MKKQTIMGQKILFPTQLFGKNYFWMEDGDGTTYLVRASKTAEGWVPDFT